jgi:uncharacterized membrane protein
LFIAALQCQQRATIQAIESSREQPLSKTLFADRLFTGLCWFQGVYYFATGVWPLVSVRSFQMVTGEKTDNLPTGLEADHWLLMTVSLLITSISLALLMAAYRRTRTAEIGLLAVASAIGLTAIDVIYVTRRVILPIYLLDAVIEVPLIIAWCIALVLRRGRDGTTS